MKMQTRFLGKRKGIFLRFLHTTRSLYKGRRDGGSTDSETHPEADRMRQQGGESFLLPARRSLCAMCVWWVRFVRPILLTVRRKVRPQWDSAILWSVCFISPHVPTSAFSLPR